MEEVKRIYMLLLHSSGLKIRAIAEELNLDTYYVADIMFSTDNILYWYQDSSSLWFAKENAIQIEEPKEETETSKLGVQKSFNIERFLQGNPSESLRTYLSEMSNYRALSNDETIELFKKYRRGDRKALDKIIRSNQKLVIGIAGLYRKTATPFEDIIQEGNIGLMKAIERFDYSKFWSFTNFAKAWILQSISFAINYLPFIIKLPLNQLSLYYKIRKFKENYEQANGYSPAVNLIDIGDDIDFDKIYFLNNLPDNLKDVTLLYDNMDTFESPYSQIESNEESEYTHFLTRRLLLRLNRKEQLAIKSYYGIDTKEESLNTIAQRLCLTRERARQIVVNAVKTMRENPNKNEKDISVNDVDKSEEVISSLEDASIGDYVFLPKLTQKGRIIDIKRTGNSRIYLLMTGDRSIYKFTENGELISFKNKKSKKMSPERASFLKEFYQINTKEE